MPNVYINQRKYINILLFVLLTLKRELCKANEISFCLSFLLSRSFLPLLLFSLCLRNFMSTSPFEFLDVRNLFVHEKHLNTNSGTWNIMWNHYYINRYTTNLYHVCIYFKNGNGIQSVIPVTRNIQGRFQWILLFDSTRFWN